MRRGPSYRVLAHHRIVRFREMEYTMPAEAGPACLREVLRTIRERDHPGLLAARVPLRARDDAWLSMFHERDGCSISVHQGAELDPRPYFDVVEPIFWKYDGRPHWGKLHTPRRRRGWPPSIRAGATSRRCAASSTRRAGC